MDSRQIGVVISGGASGLGAGTAQVLAAAGARVAVLDRDAAGAEKIAAAAGGIGLGCDVRDSAALAAAFEQAARQIGPLRVLVNCAGIGPHNKTLRRSGAHPLGLFSDVIAVNLTGTFDCCRLAAAQMAQAEPLADGERGVIINTASVSAFESPAGGVAYAASKAGVAGMTLPMARDLAPHGIRVMAIAPGPFETPLFRTMSEDMRRRLTSYSAFPKQPGRPEQFGMLVQQIIENRMLNGTCIRLDAGHRAPVSYL